MRRSTNAIFEPAHPRIADFLCAIAYRFADQAESLLLDTLPELIRLAAIGVIAVLAARGLLDAAVGGGL